MRKEAPRGSSNGHPLAFLDAVVDVQRASGFDVRAVGKPRLGFLSAAGGGLVGWCHGWMGRGFCCFGQLCIFFCLCKGGLTWYVRTGFGEDGRVGVEILVCGDCYGGLMYLGTRN